ncbi:agmatine deiminase family protein [Aliiglaciecola sp. NS0011-25]|uniref:agmatine deiminase family protein n=1 Tax=Aliiglaciecola sp. NS0011-25 TaxID=3127654 RepID=UPI00310BF8CE
MNPEFKLLPEWHAQEAIILAWPDKRTDWKPWLKEVRNTYKQLIEAITQNNTGVILLIREQEVDTAKELLKNCCKLMFVITNYNDTWCRDYCFLTLQHDKKMQPIEFTFNGWGNKFDASLDNKVNANVLAKLCKEPLKSVELVAEGGALEIDQHGHLLSTALCLQNPQRNGDLSLAAYQSMFIKHLGASRVSILENGHLEGDDTDGHIDTIVRFTEDNGVVIQSCFNRPEDTHFSGLNALVNELKVLLPQHEIFELPLPNIVNEVGERLPASYANYLISNHQVLCPIYRQPEDQLALDIIASAYPDYTIVPIDSLPLVQQFGSVHCISMQIPKGTLKPEVLNNLSDGLTVYGCDA